EICYQSCNPAFSKIISKEETETVKTKYQLPETYLLYVGSIIERKNLLTICKAIHSAGKDIDRPLVAIGDGGAYKEEVKEYIRQNGLQSEIILLSESPLAINSPEFRSAADFPAIYQGATAMIYPSVFEGFGIPVLEALASRLPVITSNVSCMPETGGDAAFYANPDSAEQIADGMKQIYTNEDLSKKMVEKGLLHAQKFAPEKYASNMIDIYKKIW